MFAEVLVLTLPAAKPNSQSSAHPGLRLAWIVCSVVFAPSLFGALGMVFESISWMRDRGVPPPNWFQLVSAVLQWGLILSAVGLAGLIAQHIRQIYRNQ